MVNINARINWKPGMELTAQTFLDLDANLDVRQQVAIRAALGDRCMGVLPETPFHCSGSFYTNKFEIERFQCTALLPSGKMIQVDEPVSVTVPILYGNEYYLTVGLGTGQTTFEKEGVSYIRPQYTYAIIAKEDLILNDVLPIIRFVVNNGVFVVDNDFIPPCLMLPSHSVFATLRQHYVEQLTTLAEHANLKEGDGKRAMQRYLFMMKAFNMEGRVADFVNLTQEIAHAVDYFIMKPNTEQQVEIPQPMQGDVMKWLRWVEEFLTGAATMLDGLVLEDDTIDYEALLAQAKKELYDQLNPELYEKLLANIKEKLREELTSKLTQEFTTYMEETLKPNLGRILSNELHEKLYEKLYTELFEHLFNALYVPEPKEKEYIPLI